MKRKLRLKNKRKVTSLLRYARQNDMPLGMYVAICRQRAISRSQNREARRYGVTKIWEEMEPFGNSFMTVPMVDRRGHLLGYELVTGADRMPEDKRHLWQPLEISREHGS